VSLFAIPRAIFSEQEMELLRFSSPAVSATDIKTALLACSFHVCNMPRDATNKARLLSITFPSGRTSYRNNCLLPPSALLNQQHHQRTTFLIRLSILSSWRAALHLALATPPSCHIGHPTHRRSGGTTWSWAPTQRNPRSSTPAASSSWSET